MYVIYIGKHKINLSLREIAIVASSSRRCTTNEMNEYKRTKIKFIMQKIYCMQTIFLIESIIGQTMK